MDIENKKSKIYNIIIIILIITGIVLFTALLVIKNNEESSSETFSEYGSTVIKDKNHGEFVNNELMIIFYKDVSKLRAQEILEEMDLQIMNYMKYINTFC